MTSSIGANTTSILSTTLSNTATQETDSTTATSSTASTTEVTSDAVVSASDSVDFSSRAMKIQSIANDFFSGGGLQMADIADYVQRLKTDGFLTEEQADKLGVEKTTAEKASEAKEEVINFIDGFKETVSEQEGNDSLFSLLDRAKQAVESLGDMSSPVSQSDFTLIDIELKSYLESDDAQQWSEQDLDSLSQVSKLLTVASDLSYGAVNSTTVNSTAANSYAQVSGY